MEIKFAEDYNGCWYEGVMVVEGAVIRETIDYETGTRTCPAVDIYSYYLYGVQCWDDDDIKVIEPKDLRKLADALYPILEENIKYKFLHE